MKTEIKNILTALVAGAPEVDVVDIANPVMSNSTVVVEAKTSKVLDATNINRTYETGPNPVQNAKIAKSTGNAFLTMDIKDRDDNNAPKTRTVLLSQIVSIEPLA